MKEKEIKIDGMTCHHCVMAVKRELDKLPSVSVKEVKIGSALLEYEDSGMTSTEISAAVERAGYRVLD